MSTHEFPMDRVSGFILAAGEGRRLRPATLTRPKALVPFCGVPLLELAASQLHGLGLAGTAVNVSYQATRVRETADRLAERNGWDLRVSEEDRLLDTGGGLRYGLRLLPDAEHLLVHNVDIILDYDLRELVRAHLSREADATVLLIPDRGPRTVTLNEDGTVRHFRNPPGTGAYTFSGVHLLRRGVLDGIAAGDSASIIDMYHRVMAAGGRVVGVVPEGPCYWADLGTADQYIRAHGEIADCSLMHHPLLRRAQEEQARRRATMQLNGVLCTGAAGLGEGLIVPAGSQLHNVVLWDYTRLPEPLLYADGIFVGDDVRAAAAVAGDRVPHRNVYRFLDVDPVDAAVIPLQKQGSGRRYCRVSAGDRSWVWCAYDPHRRENAGYAAISDFLARIGIRVPEVLLHLPDVCEIVSRDLGQHDLQRLQTEDKTPFLNQVAEQIARLHVLGDKAVRLEELPLQRGFTRGLYDWERDYFRQHILQNLLGRPELWSGAAQAYCRLRTRLLQQPQVPVHRDLQSANIMVVDGEVYLIDFQGMRPGCAAYDLGSLLYDPYQCYPREVRESVWAAYCDHVRSFGGVPPEPEVLHGAAVQRLFQALGAYGKLWLQDGLDWYRRFIVPGLRMLATVGRETDAYPEISELAESALELATDRIARERDPVVG